MSSIETSHCLILRQPLYTEFFSSTPSVLACSHALVKLAVVRVDNGYRHDNTSTKMKMTGPTPTLGTSGRNRQLCFSSARIVTMVHKKSSGTYFVCFNSLPKEKNAQRQEKATAFDLCLCGDRAQIGDSLFVRVPSLCASSAVQFARNVGPAAHPPAPRAPSHPRLASRSPHDHLSAHLS